jgi:hypothetical protein
MQPVPSNPATSSNQVLVAQRTESIAHANGNAAVPYNPMEGSNNTLAANILRHMWSTCQNEHVTNGMIDSLSQATGVPPKHLKALAAGASSSMRAIYDAYNRGDGIISSAKSGGEHFITAGAESLRQSEKEEKDALIALKNDVALAWKGVKLTLASAITRSMENEAKALCGKGNISSARYDTLYKAEVDEINTRPISDTEKDELKRKASQSIHQGQIQEALARLEELPNAPVSIVECANLMDELVKLNEANNKIPDGHTVRLYSDALAMIYRPTRQDAIVNYLSA